MSYAELSFPDLCKCLNCEGKGEFFSLDYLDKLNYDSWERISHKVGLTRTPKGTYFCTVCNGTGKPESINLKLENEE